MDAPSSPDRTGTVAPPCRSVPPDGDPCAKPRGHRSHWHQGAGPRSRLWEDGVRAPARWQHVDDGYRTDGDYDAMRMTGMRW